MSLATQDLLHDRYRIVRIIKSGGMGSVYEAVDTKLGHSSCAVKEIHEAARTGKDSEYILGRFEEEMKALAVLEHPSIPRVRDYLAIDSTIFIVMDLVKGRSLDEEIEGRPQPPERAVQDMLQLLDVLVYLHGQEPPIVHRDIKPANILRDARTGAIKLVDFGLAKAVGGTQTQTVVGTLGYCSPEQMMGKAEERSDLYAVGVTLSQLLTGQQPEMMLFEPRRPVLSADIRPGLSDIIARATQPHPGERYATAADMAADLRAWLYQGQPSGGPMEFGQYAPPVARPGLVASGAAAAESLPSGTIVVSEVLESSIQSRSTLLPSQAPAPPTQWDQPRVAVSPAQATAVMYPSTQPPAPWLKVAGISAVTLLLGGAMFLVGQRSSAPAAAPAAVVQAEPTYVPPIPARVEPTPAPVKPAPVKVASAAPAHSATAAVSHPPTKVPAKKVPAKPKATAVAHHAPVRHSRPIAHHSYASHRAYHRTSHRRPAERAHVSGRLPFGGPRFRINAPF